MVAYVHTYIIYISLVQRWTGKTETIVIITKAELNLDDSAASRWGNDQDRHPVLSTTSGSSGAWYFRGF